MGPLDALWHVLNLFAPALGLGLLASSLSKLLWRHALAAVPWRRLAAWACTAALLAQVAGLLLSGHDGRMATYAAMVLASTMALWWVGFGPGRR